MPPRIDILSIIDFFQEREEKAYGRKENELKLAIMLGNKTGNYSLAEKVGKELYGEGWTIPGQPTVGGEEKKVAKPTDVAAGGGAPPGPPEQWYETKRVGGTPVSQDFLTRLNEARILKKQYGPGFTPQMEKQYVSQIKPTSLTDFERKLQVAEVAAMLPNSHPLKEPYQRISGTFATERKAGSAMGWFLQNTDNLTWEKILNASKELAKSSTRSTRALREIDSLSRGMFKGKSLSQLTPDEHMKLQDEILKRRKYTWMAALMGMQPGDSAQPLTLDEKMEFKRLDLKYQTGKITDEEYQRLLDLADRM